MKTIAISIDESSLAAIDRIAGERDARARGAVKARARKANRSAVIRRALRDFIVRRQKQEREERERVILKAHGERVRRQAEALVAEQARP